MLHESEWHQPLNIIFSRNGFFSPVKMLNVLLFIMLLSRFYLVTNALPAQVHQLASVCTLAEYIALFSMGTMSSMYRNVIRKEYEMQ